MISSELEARLRKELEEHRETIVAELEGYGVDVRGDKVDRIAGIDEGFADSAAATSERAEAMAFITTARERLAEADEALQRMDEGTYGTCASCGQEIPEARLEARPMSVTCVSCAEKT